MLVHHRAQQSCPCKMQRYGAKTLTLGREFKEANVRQKYQCREVCFSHLDPLASICWHLHNLESLLLA